MITVEFSNRQQRHSVKSRRLIAAAREVLLGEGVRQGELSLAVVSDDEIQVLNRQFLEHDYATDVLSFLLDASEGQLDGEVIVSADTAARAAQEFGWNFEDELLLYVIHGTLHLAGYDDQTPEDQKTMRERERHYLMQYGLVPRYDDAE